MIDCSSTPAILRATSEDKSATASSAGDDRALGFVEAITRQLSRPLDVTKNILAEPLSKQATPARCGWLLLGMLALCFAPRTLMALKLDVICPDGILYVDLASAVERGDLERAFTPLSINIYPIVLACLHRCGLDWETAGKCWGVAMASLTVLPLFGWIRRQFDQRLALAAALLYAVHPKFIEWSPELIRDQTFWFLSTLSIYLLWRAAAEVRLRWYLAAGVTVTLAIHTRFEGWFLLMPAILWTCERGWALCDQRVRLLTGLTACVCMYPLLLGTVQRTWLRELPNASWGDFHHLAFVQDWLKEKAGFNSAATVTTAPPNPVAPAASSQQVPSPPTPVSTSHWLPPGKAFGLFVHTMRRGLDDIFAGLMIAGLWIWRRVWLRRDSQPLFYIVLLVLAGTWIHLGKAHESSSRYALLIVILASPFAAAGLLSLVGALARYGKQPASHPRLALLGIGLLSIGIIGWTDALTSREPSRHRDAALGKWLQSQYASRPRIATSASMPLVAYYAGLSPREMPVLDSATAREQVEAADPAIVVVSQKQANSPAWKLLVGIMQGRGMESVPQEHLPSICRQEYLVFQHSRLAARTDSARQ
jgi:hypothetical protein